MTAQSLLPLFVLLLSPPAAPPTSDDTTVSAGTSQPADVPADTNSGTPPAEAPGSEQQTGPTGVSGQPEGPSPAPEPPASADKPSASDEALSVADVFGDSGDDSSAGETATQGSGQAGASTSSGETSSVDDVFGSGSDSSDATDDMPAMKSAKSASSSSGGKKGLFDGKLTTRFRILTSLYVDVDRVPDRGTIGRNENRIEMYFSYSPNEHVEIVGDIEPVFMGVAQAQELDDLATRQMLTPFHLESDAAYVALHDLLPGFDLKIGRQIVVWGAADKFNPTNNLNPDDLEDRPLFTEPIANQMIVMDFAPKKLKDKLWFQGVYIPLFYPALLPPSAAAGLKSPYSEVPFALEEDRLEIEYLQDTFLPRNQRLIPVVYGHVNQPGLNLKNGQAAVKVGTRLSIVDISASYYYGRHDIPLPSYVDSSQLAPLDEDPVDGYYIQSDVDLIYPKMQVIGLDFATQLPFLGNMGLWGEAGLFIPEAQELTIELPVVTDVTPDDGVANPVAEIVGPTVTSTPFVKATVGLDYTFGKHVYVQSQYLRGFIDEFGARNIGNYLLAGTDLVFFGRHLIFRMFGLVDFPSNNRPGEGASAVIAPAILMTPPWGFVSFELGGFAFLSRKIDLGNDVVRNARTKFGQDGTGSSIVYLKAIGSF